MCALGNVTDGYPPQAKAFALLAFIARHYGDGAYKWFVRADDDVYMNLESLTRFVTQFDERKVSCSFIFLCHCMTKYFTNLMIFLNDDYEGVVPWATWKGSGGGG